MLHMADSSSQNPFTVGRSANEVEDLRARIFQFIQFDKLRGGHVETVWQSMLAGAYPCLRDLPLVDQLTHIIARAWVNRERWRSSVDPQLFQFCEFCAGWGNLSKKLLQANLFGASYDIIFSQMHDMLSFPGLRLHCDSWTASLERSLHWIGTPCSSFVHMCCSVSRRAAENQWRGDTSRNFVCVGNALSEVTALMLLISTFITCFPVLEQPASSCLPRLSSVCNVLCFCGFVQTTTYLGAFNGPTVKQLQLWHLPGTFESLARPKPDPCLFSSTLVDRSETGYTGKKDELALSERYTPEFGEAVRDCLLQIR